MPEITVVITAYNLGKYLDRCFEQIFAQTYQDFDVLVVDDCSTDGTRGLIDRWALRYPDRFRKLYLEHNTGAPSLARNAALDSGLIDGESFLFMDGDDEIEPTLLEKLHDALTGRHADVAICGYDRVDADTGRVLCREMLGFPATVDMPPSDDVLAFVNTAPWNKLWRREIFGDGRFPPFRVGEEVALLFTRYLRSRRLAFVDEVLIHYSVHAGSVISNTSQETIRQFAGELAQCHRALKEPVSRDTMGLIAFMHIGISMAIRAMDNRTIRLNEHLRWTWRYLTQNYGGMKGNPFLRLRSLARHGAKGIGLWGCLICYRLHIFLPVLRLYGWASRALHVDIKF